jgi:hypothetical protein
MSDNEDKEREEFEAWKARKVRKTKKRKKKRIRIRWDMVAENIFYPALYAFFFILGIALLTMNNSIRGREFRDKYLYPLFWSKPQSTGKVLTEMYPNPIRNLESIIDAKTE